MRRGRPDGIRDGSVTDSRPPGAVATRRLGAGVKLAQAGGRRYPRLLHRVWTGDCIAVRLANSGRRRDILHAGGPPGNDTGRGRQSNTAEGNRDVPGPRRFAYRSPLRRNRSTDDGLGNPDSASGRIPSGGLANCGGAVQLGPSNGCRDEGGPPG